MRRMNEKDRLKRVFETREFRELPPFGRALVVAFGLFFGVFIEAVDRIDNRGKTEVKR